MPALCGHFLWVIKIRGLCFAASSKHLPVVVMKHKLTRYIQFFFTSTLLAASFSLVAQDAPQMNLERIKLSSGMHRIDAQVASTPDQRQIGLMFRKDMPQHEGMIFVFDQPGKQCFWMKNTLIPLSAAFIADDGTIVNIEDMKPLVLDGHCSTQPVRYVLEMNKGWFAKKGLKAGSKLQGSLFQAQK
jgi:uncharacterized protein